MLFDFWRVNTLICAVSFAPRASNIRESTAEYIYSYGRWKYENKLCFQLQQQQQEEEQPQEEEQEEQQEE